MAKTAVETNPMVNAATIAKLPTALKPAMDEQDANAAVTLLLKPTANDFEILLVKRAKRTADSWSGQMAFPGGKRESQDQNLKATAIRETQEETDIDVAKSRFLGVLNTVQSVPRGDFRILPFVAVLDMEPQIKLNISELEWHIWVPYERLIKSEGITAELGYGHVPAFLLENVVVWGITYKILSEFIKIVEALKTQ